VREVVDDDRVAVTKLERVLSEPSPESSTERPAYELLSRTIHEVFPDVAATAPSLVVGATDSRHFTPVADDVYRFAPIRVGPADLRRVHGTDERLAVGQIPPAVEFYRRLLRASGSPPRPR
ncbi:MAG: M20/M25/M40 family metallo-hydrolase, partial [Candidatus Binatia bacterium]